MNRIVPEEPARGSAPHTGPINTAGIVLSVENLRTEFRTTSGPIAAVDGVSFDLRAGETLCVVGEIGRAHV